MWECNFQRNIQNTFSSVSKCSNLDNFPVVTISWICIHPVAPIIFWRYLEDEKIRRRRRRRRRNCCSWANAALITEVLETQIFHSNVLQTTWHHEIQDPTNMIPGYRFSRIEHSYYRKNKLPHAYHVWTMRRDNNKSRQLVTL
jgi:hypothetical protein